MLPVVRQNYHWATACQRRRGPNRMAKIRDFHLEQRSTSCRKICLALDEGDLCATIKLAHRSSSPPSLHLRRRYNFSWFFGLATLVSSSEYGCDALGVGERHDDSANRLALLRQVVRVIEQAAVVDEDRKFLVVVARDLLFTLGPRVGKERQ